VTYTVTAQDGLTIAVYTVTAQEILNSIADIAAYLSSVSGGGSAADPIPLPAGIDLSGAGWSDLLSAIGTAGKYVVLDLSACTMGGPEFDPGVAGAGEWYIVSLVLPDDAERIRAEADTISATFRYFTALTGVAGAGVKTVGGYAFSYCTALEAVNLPAVTSIGIGVFLPSSGMSLSLTLGNTAPSVGIGMFNYFFIGFVKTITVTVRVPSGATGYGTVPGTYTGADRTNNWGNAFRDMGWDGTSYLSGAVNTFITLNIRYITP
jgi:hypothetical protein